MPNKTYTFITICLAHLIRALSYLVPRSDKIWVCIGWHNSSQREIFADNSKYFFLYLQNEQPDCKAVWISRDKKMAEILTSHGYSSYYMHTIKGIYYALRAKYTIVDAKIHTRNWKFSGGSRVTQLWHGKGMKKSGHDGNYNSSHSYFKTPAFHLKYDSLVATSQKTASLLSKAFSQPVEDIMITGQPRTDIFYREIKGSEIDTDQSLSDLIKEARKTNKKKTILYAPTFRADGSNPFAQLTEDKLLALNTILQKNNYLFILSLHPKFAARDVINTNKYSHIESIAAGFDMYPYFDEIDTVITDYSNIYIDFLLLDKEVIFFTFDEERYRKLTGLHEDFNTLTPGPHVKTFNELLLSIENEDIYMQMRSDVRKILFKQEDGDASQRIYSLLTK